ncbi:hypothetical protein ALC57_15736 [Trachymyrmex cornetzi]|uniref:Uncharacterized protein n=1 Tax=Trachymyrmex cornetzi TaxID=471704 RepID=A0A151IWC3_9HYME|nr:hypothetical protein ALC57_15736 [Trachymyrmex cornetzi]
MRTDEESRRTSVASFCSVQTLTHLVNIPSLLVETLPRFERQRQFVSAMISQGDLHVTLWTNVDSNFQILVARTRQVVTSAHLYIHLYLRLYIRCTYVCTYVYTYEYTYIRLYLRVYVHTFIRALYVYIYIHLYIRLYIRLRLYIYAYIHTHSRFSRPLTYTRALLSSHSSTPITAIVHRVVVGYLIAQGRSREDDNLRADAIAGYRLPFRHHPPCQIREPIVNLSKNEQRICRQKYLDSAKKERSN